MRDVHKYVLSCRFSGRKKNISQQLALLPVRAVEPWGLIEVDLLRIGATFLADNKYTFLFIAVDKASKFPFAFPVPLAREQGESRGV